MIKHFTKLVFFAVAALMVLAISCKKPDNKPSNNNNNNNNNTNPNAPKITVTHPGQDTAVDKNHSLFTVNIHVTAEDSAKIDSIVRTDGLTTRVSYPSKSLKTRKVSLTADTLVYDYYQAPASATGSSLNLKYVVYDSKGNKDSVTRKITIASIPIFKIYTNVELGDQFYGGNYAFLNTGGNPTYLLYATGDVASNPDLRGLVDMCIAKTAGQAEIVFSPGWVNNANGSPSKTFSDSNIYNIDQGWLLTQRRTTLFKRLKPGVSVDAKTFPTYTSVGTAYTSAAGSGSPRVQYNFQPGDTYAFLTWDGRYGAFTFAGFVGGDAVSLNMALQSR